MQIRPLPVLFILSTLLLTGTGPSALAQGRTTSGTAALDAEGTVVIDNHEGRITVKTWDRAEVKYEAVVRPESDAEHPEATTVQVDRSDSRFAIRTEYNDSEESIVDSFLGGNQNIMPVAYTLTVPSGARVEIDDHESTIRVQSLNGMALLETHDGEIRLKNQGGNADLESHDGPIRVENQSGDLTIDTHDSDVRLRSVTGRVVIDAHDSEIEAQELGGGLDIDTHEGNGRLTFAEFTDDVEIDAHDGDFTLTLPADTGFDLHTDFDDDDADLRANFDLSPYRLSTDDDDEEVNYAGSVNGGGPRISLTAHDGDFEIRVE